MTDILQYKVIAIIRGVTSRQIVAVAKALAAGGIRCVEVTFNPADAAASLDTLRSIALLREKFGEQLHIGAGTVLTAQQVAAAASAGATFMISPTVSSAVIEQTKSLGLVSLPGAYTPTEAQYAHECGADIIKIFPADGLALAYFKAIKAPLPHLRLAAVGGVCVDNIKDFMQVGVDVFGIGSNLVNAKLVAAENWAAISRIAQNYTQAVHNPLQKTT